MKNHDEENEIQKIINEIDTIMFGYTLKHNCISQRNFYEPFIASLLGASCATTISTFILKDSDLVIPSAVIGFILPMIISYLPTKGRKNKIKTENYNMYKKEYLWLTRKEQIKVLKLVKRLVEILKCEAKYDKNKKYIINYLDYDNGNTMFDKFEANHPQFEILSQDKIDEIHQKNKLTPEEMYFNEFAYPAVCIPADKSRCVKFGNCRDCLVDYAKSQEEWEPITFEPQMIFEMPNEKDLSKSIRIKY